MTTLEKTTGTTRIYKSFHGWAAETIINVNGQQWQISTSKRYSGQLSTNATRVNQEERADGMVITQFSSSDMFKNKTLLSEKVKVTEKAVRDQHEKALLIFDAQTDAGEIETAKPLTPEIGTIIFLDGYGKYKGSAGNNWVVFQIEGQNFKCVEKDTLELRTKDYVKPFSEKFGIGSYFEPGFKFEGSEDDLANLLIEARTKGEADQKARQEAAAKDEEIRLQKVEEGRSFVNIPEGAEALIIAELYEDESDSMTDYFNCKTVKTVYLGFSNTKRNNPHELKRLAANFEETAKLLNDEDAKIDTGYNGLPHYFFGTYKKYGWKVSKESYLDLKSEKITDMLRVAAAEGRYLVKDEETREAAEPINLDGLNVQIVDYSEKAVAVIGDTKEIKEQLKELGGKFNKFLTIEGAKQAGWIFQKSKRDDLQNLLKS